MQQVEFNRENNVKICSKYDVIHNTTEIHGTLILTKKHLTLTKDAVDNLVTATTFTVVTAVCVVTFVTGVIRCDITLVNVYVTHSTSHTVQSYTSIKVHKYDLYISQYTSTEDRHVKCLLIWYYTGILPENSTPTYCTVQYCSTLKPCPHWRLQSPISMTIVTGNGDNLSNSPRCVHVVLLYLYNICQFDNLSNSATVAEIEYFGDSHRKRSLSPKTVTVAKFCDCSCQCGQSFTYFTLL